MQQIALIIICLAIGILLRWSGKFPDTAGKVLGGWVINVALPAAAALNLHNVELNSSWWLAAATPWIGAILAIILIVPVCRALGWSRQRTGALLLVAGWGNTSFVGLPMIAALAGSQWLGLGVVIDLLGSYLALSTLGLAIATAASAGHFDWRAVGKRILTFPPFIAITLSFTFNHVDRPQFVTALFQNLSDTLTPIAMAAVGFALRFDRISTRLGAVAVGLGYRLLIAPLALVLLYVAIGHSSDAAAKVAMLEMAMPPMLGASIIAMEHNLEPDLVALIIGIGVPLSMLTAFGWWRFIAPL